MKKEKYAVTGMSCSACSARVEKAVNKLPGIEKAGVNLLTNSMQVEYDEKILDAAKITEAVEEAGYGILPLNKDDGGSERQNKGENPAVTAAIEERENMRKRLLYSFCFLVPLMILAMAPMLKAVGIEMPAFLQNIFYGTENIVVLLLTMLLLTVPVLFLNRAFFTKGIASLLHGAPNMDTLVAVGAGTAALYGIYAFYRIAAAIGVGDFVAVELYSKNIYLESAAMIVTLITLGKYLEARAKGRTGSAIQSLMELAPETARVLRNGEEVEVDTAELVPGDELIIGPGETVSVDGSIISGKGSIDEAAITGESLPVEKQQGDQLISGTLNLNGYFHYRAEKTGEDTTIRKIIALVEEASATKAPIARLADKVAGIFVPVVMTLAAATAAFWLYQGAGPEFALKNAVSVLLISCPCALGLATPVAIMVGTGRGAEAGILIKSGESLETAHEIDTVVLDKTGTVTEGKPVVTDIYALAENKTLKEIYNRDKDNFAKNEKELLALLAGLEKGSTHPLAQAVLNFAEEQQCKPAEMSDIRTVFGKGVVAKEKSGSYSCGNMALMQDMHVDVAAVEEKVNDLADEGKTPVFFAEGEKLLAIVAVADVIKKESRAAIEAFGSMGINVLMLTGDNERTAEAIGRQLAIPEVRAGLMPEDKEKEVRKLQEEGHVTAMIGDGINDAPALAAADVGIAIGAGTDVAIESADIVLMHNELTDAVDAVRLSKAVIKNIKENLFWAFFYNIICIPVAAGALYHSNGISLNPMIAAGAMSLSSVTVVMNALRLKRFKVGRKMQQPENEVLVNCPVQNNINGENKPGKVETKMEKTLKIEGMMCAHCQKHVHDALAAMDGVTAVDVDLEGAKATVTSSEEISTEEFRKVIEGEGYTLK